MSPLHGKDVLVRMATVAGKSLTMFLVPLYHSPKAVGLIVSPLNSLMDEQVRIMITDKTTTLVHHGAHKAWHPCIQSF